MPKPKLIGLMGVHGCGKSTVAKSVCERLGFRNLVYDSTFSAAKSVYRKLRARDPDSVRLIDPIEAAETYLMNNTGYDSIHVYTRLIEQVQSMIINEWIRHTVSQLWHGDDTVVITDRIFDPLAYAAWHVMMYRVVVYLIKVKHKDDKLEPGVHRPLLQGELSDWCRNNAKAQMLPAYAAIEEAPDLVLRLMRNNYQPVLDSWFSLGVDVSIVLMPTSWDTLYHHSDVSLPWYFYDQGTVSLLESLMVFVLGFVKFRLFRCPIRFINLIDESRGSIDKNVEMTIERVMNLVKETNDVHEPDPRLAFAAP